MLAAERADEIGFGNYVISATSPFREDDLCDLTIDAAKVVRRYVDFDDIFARRGWTMYPTIDRVYVNHLARAELGWRPVHDFATALDRVRSGASPLSGLARAVGVKGYHDTVFESGPCPVDSA